MKRARGGPLFGPVPIYVVNVEQLPYAERVAKKFLANDIPAAVVHVTDRVTLGVQMQALAGGQTFHAVVIHPRSEADRTVAFIGANIESPQIPGYEDLDPDTAIDFIQQQQLIAEDKRDKWYEQHEARTKLRRKQVLLQTQLAREGDAPPPLPPSLLAIPPPVPLLVPAGARQVLPSPASSGGLPAVLQALRPAASSSAPPPDTPDLATRRLNIQSILSNLKKFKAPP